MILGKAGGELVSKFAMFELIRRTISPPYCGLPSLSHQCPVVEADVVVVLAVAVVVVLAVVVGIEVCVEVVVDVLVDDVVDVAQDARASDVTKRQLSAIQIAFLFINLLFNNNLPGN